MPKAGPVYLRGEGGEELRNVQERSVGILDGPCPKSKLLEKLEVQESRGAGAELSGTTWKPQRFSSSR